MLIVQDGVIHPLEFKKTASPTPDAVRHFPALDKLGLPVGAGGVVCLARQSLPLTERTRIVPVTEI